MDSGRYKSVLLVYKNFLNQFKLEIDFRVLRSNVRFSHSGNRRKGEVPQKEKIKKGKSIVRQQATGISLADPKKYTTLSRN